MSPDGQTHSDGPDGPDGPDTVIIIGIIITVIEHF